MADEKSGETKATPKERARLGGQARADKLSPERRKEISAKALQSRWKNKPIQATHAGDLKIGDAEFVCANLPDGRRVISEKHLMDALGRGYSGYYSERDNANPDAAVVPRFVSPKALQPYFSSDPAALQLFAPIAYIPPAADAGVAGRVLKGINAEAVPVICEVWLRAREAGALKGAAQEQTAAKAEALIRALARVAIVALVDEATGYQEARGKRALRDLLDAILMPTFGPWSKRFPDAFYEMIYRLKGWTWHGMSKNRPFAVAQITNDLVYSRLAPGVMGELRARNPAVAGRRAAKHHQFLTSDVGHPALTQHMHTLLAFGRVHQTWDAFYEMVNAALPKYGSTLQLDFEARNVNLLPPAVAGVVRADEADDE